MPDKDGGITDEDREIGANKRALDRSSLSPKALDGGTSTDKSKLSSPPTRTTEKSDADLRKKFAATVLAEGEPEGTQDKKIGWVYFNFVNKKGLSGLNASSAFRLTRLIFRVWMVALKDETYAKDSEVIKGYSDKAVTLKEYVESPYFRAGPQKRADAMVSAVADMFAAPDTNPYKTVTNQGSAGYGITPSNRSDINRDDEPWRHARLYHWLQTCGELQTPSTALVVEILGAKNKDFQTVLIDADALAAYFKKNPKQDRDDIEKYTAETEKTPPCKAKKSKQ